MRVFLIMIVLFYVNYSASFSEDNCKVLSKKVCVDESERNIGGYKTKQCWRFEEKSKCISKEDNHCVSLESNRGCNEFSSKCLEESTLGRCRHLEKKFVCSSTLGQKEEIQLVDAQFTVLRDEKDLKNCEKQEIDKYCMLLSEHCSEAAATRNISGKDVYKDCWKWDRKYKCHTDTALDECSQYKDMGCKEIKKECIHSAHNRCEHYVLHYVCDEKEVKDVECIGMKFCLGGVCKGVERTPNKNFGKAMSHLGVLANMKKDMEGCSCSQDTDQKCHEGANNPESCKMFKGSAKKCKRVTGEYNCCSHKGFIRDIVACNKESKELDSLRNAGVCHFVGAWKDDLLIEGDNLVTRQFYCCFHSKLARIIQEQGRNQLSMGWGSGENPDCRALSLEQITKLKFEEMDFSELYQELEHKAKQSGDKMKVNQMEEMKAGTSTLANTMKKKMERFYDKK